MTPDPFDVYARLDPARGVRPDWDVIGTLVVDTIDERTGTMTVQLERSETRPGARTARTGDRPGRRRALLLAAAAALVAMGVAAVAFSVRDSDEVPADDPVAPPTTTTETSAPSAQSARSLDEHERVFAGRWNATAQDGTEPSTFDVVLGTDGTFDITSLDGLCDGRGMWSVDADVPTLLANGTCAAEPVTIEAEARPERLSGTLTIGDGEPVRFSAVFAPSTTERALTDEELAYVGLWSTPASGQLDQPSLRLDADGTFQLTSDSPAVDGPIDGYWEVTSAGVFSLVGASEGVETRLWAAADADSMVARSSSSASEGEPADVDVELVRMQPRELDEHEVAYVGEWESWAIGLALDADGTFTAAEIADPPPEDGFACVATGVWEVAADGSSFRARGICGDERMTITSMTPPQPEQFNAFAVVPSTPAIEVTLVHRTE